MKMNKLKLELLLQEFRLWNKEWELFENNPNYLKVRPMSSEDFIKLLNKYYKVKIKK